MESIIQSGERYTMEFSWKGRSRAGHIMSVDRNEDGDLRLHEPQTGRTVVDETKVREYLKQLKYKTAFYGHRVAMPVKVLRIDDKQFDLRMVNHILEEAEGGQK